MSTFLAILAVLNLSGAGYAAIRDGVSGVVPFLAGPLGGIDETLGNAGEEGWHLPAPPPDCPLLTCHTFAAISLLLTDLTGPLLIAGALAVTPSVTEQIEELLAKAGLDAAGLNGFLDDTFEKGPTS